MKVLITCGPTWVPIDDTRVISNQSTGELGQILAQELIAKGAKVTVLQGPVTELFKKTSAVILKFHFFNELKELLNQELKKKYDVIVHAAAVSDYQLKKTFQKKLSSGQKNLKLELVPTPKLIESIKKQNPRIFLVGFKLESKLNERSAKRFTRDLFEKAKCDLVVVNSKKCGHYFGYVVNRKKGILAKAQSRQQLAERLIHEIYRHCS